MNIYLLRLVACLFVILSFNAKALVVNDCTWSGNQCYRAIFNNHDLSGLNLSVHYDDSTLTYSIFENSSGNLSFHVSNADHSNFRNSILNISSMSSSFSHSDFSFYNGNLSTTGDNDFTYVNFSNSTISGSVETDDLSNADFTNANLSNFSFRHTTLNNAIFRNTDFGTMFIEDGMSFGGSNFCGADLSSIQLNFVYGNPFSGSKYCESTIFNVGQVEVWQDDETGLMTFTPESYTFYVDFDPDEFGMIFVSEVPLPPGISLFLSGLVGLGLMKGRNA